MKNQISVIIPTYNGAHRIKRLLEGLKHQTYMDFEIIVVCDGSIDNTEEVVETNKGSLTIKIINQDNKGRAGARNAGARVAKGKYFIFYDDDVRPQSNSVKHHREGLELNDITVGQQLEPEDGISEFQQCKAILSQEWLRNLGDAPVVLYAQNLFLTAANMGIRAQTFFELNGFDERLRDAEDYDLAVRAFYAKKSILYIPKNIVEHHAFERCVEYVNRQREYRIAQQKLIDLRKNDDPLKLYHKYDVQKSQLKSFFYFFIPGRTARWVDKGYFKFLPFSLRMKIYPRVISALSVYYPQRKL